MYIKVFAPTNPICTIVRAREYIILYSVYLANCCEKDILTLTTNLFPQNSRFLQSITCTQWHNCAALAIQFPHSTTLLRVGSSRELKMYFRRIPITSLLINYLWYIYIFFKTYGDINRRSLRLHSMNLPTIYNFKSRYFSKPRVTYCRHLRKFNIKIRETKSFLRLLYIYFIRIRC